MYIKVLGSGCPSCIKLEKNVRTVIEQLELEATVEKVTDMKEILGYGVMGTPALVVDEKVVSTGKVLSPKDIIKLIG